MKKGEQTKELIITKAAELFNLYGYDGCSLSDIMKATNLKKGGVYNHFSNKDEIALAAYELSYQKVFARFRSQLDKDATSKDKLNSIIKVFASFSTDPVLKGGCPIINTAMDSADTHPQLKERARAAIDTLHQYIVIKLEEGVKNGAFYQDIKPSIIATIIISTLEGALVFSRASDHQEHMNNAVEFIQTYLAEKVYR